MSPKKDDLPAMPFYVGDWLKAPDIQCLSYELKGLWFEMLCYMWESNERGYLLYTHEELSRLLRLPQNLLEQKLMKLNKKGVFSIRSNDGAIYSRKMVRDQQIRELRTKSGSLGGRRTFSKHFAQAKVRAKCESENAIESEDKNKPEIKKDVGVKGKKDKRHLTYVKDNPPSFEDVRAYCIDRKNGIDAQAFIDRNTAVGWKDKNGNLYQDWKAVIRTWESWRKSTTLPDKATQIKRPVAIVVVEKIAAGQSDHDILHDLVGTYTEHDINEALMNARENKK